MTRIAYTNRDNQEITYSQLAIAGINELLDYLSKHRAMEFVSLVSKRNKRGIECKWVHVRGENYSVQNRIKNIFSEKVKKIKLSNFRD
jgi:hypothetical protein